MKNIHVLPADKPSNGYILGKCIKELSDVKIGQLVKTYHLMFDEEYFKPQNIYITSDEEIKEGDWFMSDFNSFPIHNIKELSEREGTLGWEQKDLKNNLKIILTTDQDLIKDGVQAIDYEFLEWFVKNPSCERIEVNGISDVALGGFADVYYKIIIPRTTQQIIDEDYAGGLEMGQIPAKEETKQETLEEIAEKYSEEFFNRDEISMRNSKVSYIAGAKWQVKQDKQEIQYLRSRLDFVHESSAKAIELIEALQLQTEGMYNEDTIRQVLSKLTLVNPVDLRMTSNGHGEFPDGYKLTEKGIDCIVEQLKK
jgi:hypothetical protein